VKRIKLTLRFPETTVSTLNKLAMISGKSRTAIICELVANYGVSVISEKPIELSEDNSRL
jgi:hypothetical protein